MCTAVLLLSIQTIDSNNKKFCQVMTVHLQFPVAKPVHSVPGSEAEKAYLLYESRLKLSKQLGC